MVQPTSRGVSQKWPTTRGVAHPIQPWCTPKVVHPTSRSLRHNGSGLAPPRLQFWLPPNLKSGFPRSKYGSPCSSTGTLCLGPLYVLSHHMSGDICLEPFVLSHYMSGDTCHKTLYVLRHHMYQDTCRKTLHGLRPMN